MRIHGLLASTLLSLTLFTAPASAKGVGPAATVAKSPLGKARATGIASLAGVSPRDGKWTVSRVAGEKWVEFETRAARPSRKLENLGVKGGDTVRLLTVVGKGVPTGKISVFLKEKDGPGGFFGVGEVGYPVSGAGASNARPLETPPQFTK